MQARMKNPGMVIPDALPAILALRAATEHGGVPPATLELVHLRPSQINGSSSCVDPGTRHARQAGESDRRPFAVAAWRDSPHFDDAERAALPRAKPGPRLRARPTPIPDAIWGGAARHYDEPALAALILSIATTNVFNRLNVSTRQPAGAWG